MEYILSLFLTFEHKKNKLPVKTTRLLVVNEVQSILTDTNRYFLSRSTLHATLNSLISDRE